MSGEWSGQACVVLASGPSLGWDRYEDVETVQQSGLKVIAVNSTWEFAPWCDVIYAGDHDWWRANHKRITSRAARWSNSRASENLYGAKYRNYRGKYGYNSGANAIELAANEYGAGEILLVGFDCSLKNGSHHHGDHKKLRNPTPDRVALWQKQFAYMQSRISARVINCSRYTELEVFPRVDLRAALCAHI